MCCTSSLFLISILTSNIASLALADKSLLAYRGVDEGRDCFDECLKNLSSPAQAKSICQQQCSISRRKKRSAIDQSSHYGCVQTTAIRKEEIGNITNIAVNFNQHWLQNGTIAGWIANLTWDTFYLNQSLYSSDVWKGFEVHWVKGKESNAELHCRFNNKSVTWTTIKMFDKSDFPLYVLVEFYPSSELETENGITMKPFYPEGIFQPTHSPVVSTPDHSRNIYYITGSVSGGIVFAVTLILLIRKHRKRSYYSTLNPPDVTIKEYDASIIFSSEDEKFVVNNLLRLLEKENHFKCCVHFRDWNAGENIIESMVTMVNNCKRVIAVMSKHFMASGFCQQELDIALGRLANQRDCIIVINLGVAIKDIPVPLQKRTFIDLTSSAEKKTWRTRLVRQISRENPSGNVDEKTGENELIDSRKNHEYEESCKSNTPDVQTLIYKENHCDVSGCIDSCSTSEDSCV